MGKKGTIVMRQIEGPLVAHVVTASGSLRLLQNVKT